MPVYSTSTVTATLAISTAYSALEIKTPSSTGIKVVKWWCEFNGITTSNSNALVQIGQFSAAVTTNTAVTPAKVDWGDNGLASQCTVGVNATAEGAGTFNASYEQHTVPSTSGLILWEPDTYAWQIPASSFFRIRITPGGTFSGITANVGCTWVE
jgi:hypothetical protein